MSVLASTDFFMKEKEKKKFQFRFPLWAKSLAILIVSVFIVGGTAIFFFSSSVKSITRKHYFDHSIELADTLGLFVDIDNLKTVKNKVEEIYQSIPEEEKVENSNWGEPIWEAYLEKYQEIWEMPAYLALFDQLSTFHMKNEAESTCLGYVDFTNERFVYLVDDSEIEDRCLPGCFDDFTEEDKTIKNHLLDGFLPEVTNMAEYGHLVSTARPIFDGEAKEENIVAFAMVDLSMNGIIAKENENTRTLSIVLGSLSFGTVVIGSLLVYFLIARPLRILTNAANEYVSDNDEELNKFAKVNIRTKDEIEDLANSMKRMEQDINRHIADFLGAEQKANEMKHLADKDALTGMNNKRLYFEIEEKINAEIKAGKAKFAVTMIDLNDLKVINDTYGHEKGDEAIVTLANVINEIYQGSLTYRIGGDEFVAISQKEDLANVSKLEKAFMDNETLKTANLTAAVGVAIYNKKVDNNFEDTFKRADAKMYRNKKEIKKLL